MAHALKEPARFDPSVEQFAADEQETQDGLNAALHDILETTSKDYGHAVRSVHAKSHGILRGRLRVHDHLPSELAQGLFAQPGEHDAVLRFSTNPGDILDDSITVPRGLAIKILDVPGERLPDAEGTTQDFVLANGPAFAAPDAKKFLANLTLLAKTTDKAEWAKKAMSAVLRGAEAALEAVGGESSMLKTLGGAPSTHPLGESYFSQVPFRYGDYIAKFSVVPASPNLTRLEEETVAVAGRPDALREEIGAVLAAGEDAVWDVRVQLNRDLDAMPIEDATVVWDEAISPFVTVATLTAPSQQSWSLDLSREIDDGMRFSVWTGLAAHRPLGQVNRARKPTYRMSADYRARVNGCPIHEPA